MPKFCLVSTYTPSADAVAPLARDLAEELAKHAEVLFLAQKRGDAEESPCQTGVKVLRCWTPTFYPFQVLKFVQHEGATVVHIQHEFFLYGQRILSALLFPLLLILLKLIRRPFVVTAHHVIPLSLVASMGAAVGIRFPLAAKMFLIPYYRAFGLASTVIVPRAKQKQVLIRDYNLAESKVYVIPHALKFRRNLVNIGRRKARTFIGISAKHVILFFGFIRPAKGLEVLVRSLSILRSRSLDVALLVVGTAQQRYASYYQRIRKTVLELGLSKNVVFAGYVPEERLELYFCAADALVFPYTKMEIESSVVLLKAAEFNRPIIATKVGDFLEPERSNVCYALVPPSDPLKLAEAIICVLANRKRTTTSLGGAQKLMERRSVKRLAQDYVQLYLKTARGAK